MDSFEELENHGKVLDHFKELPPLKRFGSSHCDDWVDRLSHVYTSLLLLAFTVVVSTVQLVGESIRCWVPAEFNDGRDSFNKYINSKCWIKNTYYIPFLDSIPTDVQQRKDAELTYYQWVPLIFLLLALMFKLPHVIWKMVHRSSGIDLHKLCKLAEASSFKNCEELKGVVSSVVFSIRRWIKNRKQYKTSVCVRAKTRLSRVCCFYGNKREGTFLTALYLVIKLLYLGNVVAQVYILNEFITNGEGVFALEWLETFTSATKYVESQRFPRVTLCDFSIRQLNNVQRTMSLSGLLVHSKTMSCRIGAIMSLITYLSLYLTEKYTVQCVQPINLFNEKLFLFLWFWLCVVAAFSIYKFGLWFYMILWKKNNYNFVKKYLKLKRQMIVAYEKQKFKKFDKQTCKRFAEDYLRGDGCFVLRMLEMNSTALVVMDVINELYETFETPDPSHEE